MISQTSQLRFLDVIRSILIAGLCCVIFDVRAERLTGVLSTEDAVKVTLLKKSITKESLELEIQNKNPFSYAYKVWITDLNGDETLSMVTGFIAPKDTIHRRMHSIVGKEFSNDIRYRAIWDLGGESTKNTQGFILPIGGNVFTTVCQSPDGPQRTHKNTPWAYDLCAGAGAPVIAAKAGIVAEAINAYTDGGMDDVYFNHDNRILIVQEDGSVASYNHLAYNSLEVKVGDVIHPGDVLGAIGMTGLTSRPHLHFAVSYRGHDYLTQGVAPQFVTPLGGNLKIKYGEVVNRYGPDQSARFNKRLFNLDAINDKVDWLGFYRSGIAQAKKLYADHYYVEALQVLTIYRQKYPTDGQAYSLTGQVYFQLGEFKKANLMFEEALRWGWLSVDTYWSYAQGLEKEQRWDEALKMNQRALDLAPGSSEITEHLAQLYAQKGMRQKAIEVLNYYDRRQLDLGGVTQFESQIEELKKGLSH